MDRAQEQYGLTTVPSGNKYHRMKVSAESSQTKKKNKNRNKSLLSCRNKPLYDPGTILDGITFSCNKTYKNKGT